MVALLPNPARAQTTGGSAVSATLQALQQQYPGVQFYEAGGRVRAIYGVPMTSGGTAREAAERWLTLYAPAFGETSPQFVEYGLTRSQSGNTVLTYTQRIDGVPVDGSMVTLVVRDIGQPRVIYTSGLVALRPQGGMPPALITIQQAQLVAQLHPAALGLTTWANVETVAIYDDPPASDSRARRVLKCVGSHFATFQSHTFYIGASNGLVLRHLNNVAHYDITGTVRGYRSKGGVAEDEPHTFGDTTWPWTQNCANAPQLSILPFVRVKGKDLVTLQEWETTTSSTGTYTLPIPNNHDAEITARLDGISWTMWDSRSVPYNPTPVPPIVSTVSAGTSVVDFQFNPQPPPSASEDEYRTAQVNGTFHVAKTWKHVSDRLVIDGPTPWLDDPVVVVVNDNAFGSISCDAGFLPLTRTIAFSASFVPPPNSPDFCGQARCANTAYSTVVSHELGHLLLAHARPAVVPGALQHAAFHEGFSDSLANLVHDVSVFGRRWCGCNCVSAGTPPGCYQECLSIPLPPPPLPVTAHARCPVSANIQYPDCTGTSSTFAHLHGMLLSGIWLDILGNIRSLNPSQPQLGLAITQQLHIDWLLLTAGGQLSRDACFTPPIPTVGRAAHLGTFYEVLVADDNDGDLGNGTPHLVQICGAFVAHGINPGECGMRPAGTPIPVDCDADGVVAVRDWACFLARWERADHRADCNRDGRVDVEDCACFQRLIASGADEGPP